MFINFSNQSSKDWGKDQIQAALKLTNDGEIWDYPFPVIHPKCSTEEILQVAKSYVEEIRMINANGVMCLGEPALSFPVVSMLLDNGIPCYSPCSDRRLFTKIDDEGKVWKMLVPQFVCFRTYRMR